MSDQLQPVGEDDPWTAIKVDIVWMVQDRPDAQRLNEAIDAARTLTRQQIAEKDTELEALRRTPNGQAVLLAWDGIIERARAAESREAALRAELAETKNDARRERCDKCGLLVHYNQIAIEVKDGAPIDDRAGFMWCHACHCRRIIEAARQEIETLKQEQGK